MKAKDQRTAIYAERARRVAHVIRTHPHLSGMMEDDLLNDLQLLLEQRAFLELCDGRFVPWADAIRQDPQPEVGFLEQNWERLTFTSDT